MHVCAAHLLVVLDGVRLGEVVGEVGHSGEPLDCEFSVVDAVLNPVVTHGDGLGLALSDCVVADADCHGVVGSDWSGGLRVVEVGQSLAKAHCNLTVQKECGVFGDGHRADD